MAKSDLLEKKITFYRQAVGSFNRLLHKDLSGVQDPDLLDGIKNGQIQKFEYCTELTWKLIKKSLLIDSGLDTKTPKESCKIFYQSGFINESDYLKLLDMIDDRNNLSHMYSEEEFKRIHDKLEGYCALMLNVLEVIAQKNKE